MTMMSNLGRCVLHTARLLYANMDPVLEGFGGCQEGKAAVGLVVAVAGWCPIPDTSHCQPPVLLPVTRDRLPTFHQFEIYNKFTNRKHIFHLNHGLQWTCYWCQGKLWRIVAILLFHLSTRSHLMVCACLKWSNYITRTCTWIIIRFYLDTKNTIFYNIIFFKNWW